MEIPSDLNALLFRLQNADKLSLNDKLEPLLSYSEALNELVIPIVMEKLEAGNYVLSQHLASLIGQTESVVLYNKVKRQIYSDLSALVVLYILNYPDKEIEEYLGKKLYELALEDGEPRRRMIVEAMENVGTTKLLPLLKAIEFELAHEPNRRPTNDAEQFVQHFENESRKEFIAALDRTKSAIKARNDTTDL
jgi:hypothetical protein